MVYEAGYEAFNERLKPFRKALRFFAARRVLHEPGIEAQILYEGAASAERQIDITRGVRQRLVFGIHHIYVVRRDVMDVIKTAQVAACTGFAVRRRAFHSATYTISGTGTGMMDFPPARQ